MEFTMNNKESVDALSQTIEFYTRLYHITENPRVKLYFALVVSDCKNKFTRFGGTIKKEPLLATTVLIKEK